MGTSTMNNVNVVLGNTNSCTLFDMGFCDEFEIKYYHPWNQSELATEHDNTSLVNDRLRLKNIPTLTEAMPFVLFTAHRTGACVEGFFNMEVQDIENGMPAANRTDFSDEELVISVGEIPNAFPLAECYLFPNPTSGDFHIVSESPVKGVSVIDSQGRLVLNSGVPESTYDMTTYPSGTYLVRVTTKDQVFNFKLIKL